MAAAYCMNPTYLRAVQHRSHVTSASVFAEITVRAPRTLSILIEKFKFGSMYPKKRVSTIENKSIACSVVIRHLTRDQAQLL